VDAANPKGGGFGGGAVVFVPESSRCLGRVTNPNRGGKGGFMLGSIFASSSCPGSKARDVGQGVVLGAALERHCL